MGGGETSRRKYPQKWPKLERDLGDAPTSFRTPPPVTVVGFVEGYQVVVVVGGGGTAYRPNNSRRDTVSPLLPPLSLAPVIGPVVAGNTVQQGGFCYTGGTKKEKGKTSTTACICRPPHIYETSLRERQFVGN